MNLMTIGGRIKHIRTQILDLSQEKFAEMIGYGTKAAISGLEKNEFEPKKEALERLSKISGKSIGWILTGIELKDETFSGLVTDKRDDYIVRSGVKVPILGLMPAGTRTEILDDEKKGDMWLPFTDIKDCVAYYITGNSMENLYYEGDLVIVRPRPIDQEIHDGRIYGLDYKIDDQLYRTVKYVYREGRDAFRLRSKNGNHKDIVVKDVIRFYRIIKEIRGFTDQLA